MCGALARYVPQSLRQKYFVGSEIGSNLVWMGEKEIQAEYGQTAGELKIPTVLQRVVRGIW